MNEQKDNLDGAAEIFERASQLQGEARERYLEGACGGDASLQADIDSMMEAHAQQGEFLASPTQGNGEPDGQTTETRERNKRSGEGPGMVIGRYKLLQHIGEGGFGTVYMAEQQEPVRRKVALKIIKLGMDTKQVIARFEAERQALAMMDHPNIAKVFDAGATETGRPYFVMELVKGVPITEYCDKNNLSTKERLDLFKPVCNAIQHAHQKGIIHRDIKPSNVMVTLHDGKPVPKVIDFGIAKATNHRLTEKTLFTEYRQLVGTPAYMSPEQAEMSGLDVDTRTDIYSLGVLLYELLTGTTPFDAEKLRHAAYGEMQRIIREVEPPRPSTRLSSLATEPVAQATGAVSSESGFSSLAEIAKHRRTDPSTLSRLIRGDLDWIVMKALEKDRTRRYETAKEFAKDIEHHLAHEPILAGPPRTIYRLRKFVKRNRIAVTAGSLVAAAIVLGLVVSTIGFVQASRQRDRAEGATVEAEYTRAAEAEQRRLAESERDLATKAKQEARRQAYVANIAAAGAALSMNEIASVRRRLEAAPEEFRNWEWRYLDARSDDSLAVLRGHQDYVYGVAFSPNGTRLASASADKTVRLWNTVTGKELAILRGHQGIVLSVAFSPDGRWLASASGSAWHDPARDHNSIRLWDVATGEQLMVLSGHEKGVWSIAFSPDGGRIASASGDETVRIWDLATGAALTVLRGHEDEVYSVAFSPDGTRLASGSEDRTVRLWDPSTGAELLSPLEHEDSVRSVAFSPDGRRLASALDGGTVIVWNLPTTEELIRLRGHEGHASSVVFSPDGARLASAYSDRTVSVWNTATGQQLQVLLGHQNRVNSIAFCPDGKRLASASHDGTVRLWDITLHEKVVLRGREAAVGRVTFNPDGTRLASTADDNSVRLWDTITGEELAVLTGHDDRVNSLAFSPDGASLATASLDNSVRLWDAATGEELALLGGHEGVVLDVSFSPDGTRVATASFDKTVRIWDASSGEEQATLRGHERAVLRIAFSPDGARLASVSGWRRLSDDNIVRIWDVATGRELSVLTGHKHFIYSVAFSPDGTRVASAGYDKTVRVWNASTGEELFCLKGHEEGIFSVAFSPDSRRVASASWDRTVRLWDTSSGEQLLVLRGHTGMVMSVAFSPEGSRLASASDDGIRIWDSIPDRTRFQERQTILAAREVAERIVEDLWRQSIDARSIAERLREEASLSDAQRCAALNLLLGKSVQLQELLNALFARLVFTDDVVAALEAEDSLAMGDRRRALRTARRRGDKPQRLNMDSWNLVCSSGNHREAYEIGLRAAEAAVAEEPNNLIFLNTLGVAQYRNGRYEDAYATLTRCDQLRRQGGDAGWPRDVAMLAVVLFKLGRIGEARAMFERWEELTHIDGIPRWYYNNATSALFKEFKELLEVSNTQPEPPEKAEGDE